MNKIFLSIVSAFSGVIIGLLANKISSNPALSWSLISATATTYLIYLGYVALKELPLIKGVKRIKTNRSNYCKEIAELISSSKKFLFYKAFTGFDLLTNEAVKSALREISIIQLDELNIVFTQVNSLAYENELNPKYNKEYLHNLHQIAIDTLKANLSNHHNLYYINEERNLIMMIMNENRAYVFFRGFTNLHASDGLLVFRIDLINTFPLLNSLIFYLKDYFIQKSQIQRTGEG